MPASASLTFVIAAYLPNEGTTILPLVRELLANRLDDRDQLIVVYREPVRSMTARELGELARRDGRLTVIDAIAATSKAEQLNAALGSIRCHRVYFLDADAVPAESTVATLRSVAFEDHTVVQGLNLIRNTSHFLGRIIAIEFFAKYLVSMPARWRHGGVAHFCGSNACWDRTAIADLRFSSESLVEDVEVSVRAALSGRSVAVDASLICTELAPWTLVDWWRQRRRWAQGWLEVGRIHRRRLLRSDRLSSWSKAVWFYVIYGRRLIYSLLAFTGIALASAAAPTSDGPLVAAGSLVASQTLSGVFQSIAVSRRLSGLSVAQVRQRWIIYYALVYPLYETLKIAVTIAALARSIRGNRDWVITRRSAR